MLQIKDEKINKIVKHLVSEQVLNTDGFVIAGGFTTALYDLFRKKHYLNFLSKNIKRTHSYMTKMSSDIDIWTIKKSQAFEILKHYNFGKNNFVKNANDVKVFGVSASKISSYAITVYAKTMPHQYIIKNMYDDINSVIKEYDLSICKTAWKDGVLYVASDCIEDFNEGKISINKEKTEIYNKYKELWSSTRIFKYHLRYGFQPERLAIEQILRSMYLAIEHKDALSRTNLNLNSIVVDLQNDKYGNAMQLSKQIIINSANAIIEHFEYLLNMDNITTFDIATFLYCQDSRLKTQIEKKIMELK